MNWLNRILVCCDCNRPTLDTMAEAGFTITRAEQTELPKAPPFVRPAVIGSIGLGHVAGDIPNGYR